MYTTYVCIYVYVHTQTPDTHIPPTKTTTTPYMLVTGTRKKRDNKHTARAASLSIKNTQYARTGVRAS